MGKIDGYYPHGVLRRERSEEKIEDGTRIFVFLAHGAEVIEMKRQKRRHRRVSTYRYGNYKKCFIFLGQESTALRASTYANEL